MEHSRIVNKKKVCLSRFNLQYPLFFAIHDTDQNDRPASSRPGQIGMATRDGTIRRSWLGWIAND